MTTGPLMLDLETTELTQEETGLLAHPQVGGVILFTRNYRDPVQLSRLVTQIRQVKPELLIAVDHEGGRVQRFRDGFSPIPPMRKLGKCYAAEPEQALLKAEQAGWLIATELTNLDIDISFAPVLDIDRGVSEVIGDRAFSDDPLQVIQLARAFVQGLHTAGMAATGKHFPGHGSVVADSHLEIPVDQRSLDDIKTEDMLPFIELAGELDALMPAHVIYPAVDNKPAGFSSVWIQDILRKELGFDGVVFSDDLSMEGATVAGSYAQRTQAALEAGCDMILVCNNRQGALETLSYLEAAEPENSPRLKRLRHRGVVGQDLAQNQRWVDAAAVISSIG